MDTAVPDTPPQPLAGLRVVEFTHMVMGPTCGMMLADMGAEVIKVEPIDGDRTRRLLGAGARDAFSSSRYPGLVAILLEAYPTHDHVEGGDAG